MDGPFHRFTELFQQLGLPSDPDSIRCFVTQHSPLDPAVRIEDASFWSPAQALLLKEEMRRNADWTLVIDQLSVALRS